MVGSLISRVISLLQQPGSIPAAFEEEGRKLLSQFSMIPSVLADAENRTYNLSMSSAEEANCYLVCEWLRYLKAAAYDTEDILDEFNYEKMCAEAGVENHEICTGLCKKWITFAASKDEMRTRPRDKLNCVAKEMDDLIETMRGFGFKQARVDEVAVVGEEEFEYEEFVGNDDDVVVGREKDINDILSILFGKASETIKVISIVCPDQETDRTTLGHSVFVRAGARQHFDLLLWVNVSIEYELGKIVKCIIDQVIGKDCCLLEGDLDLLQRRLRQELSGRRYLLVLEILTWPQARELYTLKSWLDHGAAGSFIILITASKNPSLVMADFRHDDQVMFLNKWESFQLFCRRAFRTGQWELPDELLQIGIRVIKKCGGLALGLNLLGSLMSFTKEPAAELLRVLNNRLNGTLSSIIQVCYSHLPWDAKRCFAFCTVFRCNYDTDKDIVIKLWVANGLIDSEVRGNQVFNELVKRHFIHDVKRVHRDVFGNKHEYHGRVVFKILGPLQKFALVVARHEFPGWQAPESMIFAAKVRHLSRYNDSLDLAIITDFPAVRTLISPLESFGRAVKCDALPKSNSLRALHLRSSSFRADLPELKYMKHLRYLDISGSIIRKLPEATSTLYNMQSMNLSKCLLLCRLPKGMRYMRSLRHLSVDRCPRLKKIPGHLGELSSLQTLTTYIVSEDDGCSIEEIKGLNLSGLLELYNLRKVRDAQEAKIVNLTLKTDLECLTLCWGGQQCIASMGNNDVDVMEALKPHDGLKVLKIQQYGGAEFAMWLSNPVDLKNLVELHLIHCSELKTAPLIWQLPSLRVLCLKYIDSLSYIYRSGSSHVTSENGLELFPALKRLILVGLQSLKEWQEGEFEREFEGITILNFPVLDEMEIINCPYIETMPSAPHLKNLTVKVGNPMLLSSVADLIAQSSSLVEANITNTSSVNTELVLTSRMEVEGRNKCSSLRRLRLDSTNSFFIPRKQPRHNFRPRRVSHSQLSFWRSFESLEYLDIFNCDELISWPQEELGSLIGLKRLSIRVCKHLTGLPTDPSKELMLPRLESLEIYGCPRLVEIPKCSSYLKDLELDECPEITSISSNGFLVNLETLYISCTTWTSLPNGLEHLTKLNSLRLTECYSLNKLPSEMAALTSLKSLIINKCSRVNTLPDGLKNMFSNLAYLTISNCPDLVKFCKGGSCIYDISRWDNNLFH